MYSFSSTYADPTGVGLDMLAELVVPVVIVAVLVGAACLGAWRLAARSGWHAGLKIAAVLVLVGSLAGIAGASFAGAGTKRAETSEPPRCEMSTDLDQAFRSVDHPGYFGGGANSRSFCAYQERVTSIPEALDEYELLFPAAGWKVTESTNRRIVAERDEMRFRITARERGKDDTYLLLRLEK